MSFQLTTAIAYRRWISQGCPEGTSHADWVWAETRVKFLLEVSQEKIYVGSKLTYNGQRYEVMAVDLESENFQAVRSKDGRASRLLTFSFDQADQFEKVAVKVRAEPSQSVAA